jgi:hypothetical protein
MSAPRINYDSLAPVAAERDRAQQACELIGSRLSKMRSALLRITALIETQTDPDIDLLHDIARDALRDDAQPEVLPSTDAKL